MSTLGSENVHPRVRECGTLGQRMAPLVRNGQKWSENAKLRETPLKTRGKSRFCGPEGVTGFTVPVSRCRMSDVTMSRCHDVGCQMSDVGRQITRF